MNQHTEAIPQSLEEMCQQWHRKDLEEPDGSSVDFFNFVDQEWGDVQDIDILKGAARDRLEEIWQTALYWASKADQFFKEAVRLKQQLNALKQSPLCPN